MTKVTDFNPNGIPLALAGWSTGYQSIGSNTDSNPPLSALNFVQRITSNTSNTLLNPIVNFAAGSNIALSASSNTITITGAATSGGGGGGTTITTKDEGSTLSSAVTTLDFVGAGVTASGAGATTTVTISGAGGDTFYAQPTVTNYAAAFQASSATCAVTVTAPTTGDKLVAVIMATGRGANSITQTNVTWTQRYTGNGNGVWLEVWTGVVSGTGGTTATANFTGANVDYVEIFTVNSAASAFTAATASATATGTTVLTTVSVGSLTLGNHVIVATAAAGTIASSYSGVSHDYVPLTAFGGAARSGILRLTAAQLSYWSLSSSAGAFFTAIITLT